MSDTEKILSWILKGGLLLTPFIVFIVTRSLYFPFITGKNFAFRILIEFLAALWVWVALKFPAFRPRSSAIAWAVIAFIAVMGLATIFSLSPYRSFWSNFERMEGYFTLLHLALYFFLLASAFRTARDWNIFLHTSLSASVIVSLYGFFQLFGKLAIHQGRTRIDATFGNATYFAAYLLFHLFFLIWFFLRTPGRSARAAYAIAFVIEAVMLYYTATRGAILGLFGGLIFLGLLLIVTERGRTRRWALAGTGAAVLIPLLFFLVRNAEFVRRSPVLDRFASISLQETTTQSRFTIWGMALKGWRERPILGWGQENFVYVFSKYYDPSLWRQEPWFDRAHNVFLDWLTAGGVLGLSSYLAMYAAAFFILIRSFRRFSLDGAAVSVLAALLAAHFFQNLFVFDNLTSYLLFFAVLAYLHTISVSPAPELTAGKPHLTGPPAVSPALGTAVAGTAALAFVLIFYFGNVKPLRASKAILDSLKVIQFHEPAGRIDDALTSFGRGIKLNTYGTTELREQISQAAPVIARDSSLADQDKIKFLDFALRELEAQRRNFPEDVRAKAFLATLYSVAGRPADAVATVNEALAISERRPQFYFIAAEAYLTAGQHAQALQALRRAYDLAPDYPEAVSNLAAVLILAGEETEAEALLLKHYGTAVVPEERLAKVYAERGKLNKSLAIWEALVWVSQHSAKYRAELGIAYARVGRSEDAVREIEAAIGLEPNFRAQGEAIIREIRAGRLR